MSITLNSPGWKVRTATRGAQAAGAAFPGLPAEFLVPDADLEEAVVESGTPSRGQPAAAGPLDLSVEIGPSQAAVLALRHESGALTFHLPIESTLRGVQGRPRARFRVALRPATGTTRGIVGKVVKAIVVKVAKLGGDKLASLILPKLVASFEKERWKHKGLSEGWLRVTKETLAEGKLQAGKPQSSERSLLFIHGTFSNAAAAFGPLAGSGFFERVKPIYDDRIFAFNHYSLCRTPAENVELLLEGLKDLDEAATFDVVTHSRGGLVLRTLVEPKSKGEFGPTWRLFKLGRAVLVASPNDGTPLATPDRWEQTLGTLANVIEMFPDNPLTTGAAFVANGLVWLANHASGDIPGLHAMDRGGEPIAQIQSPPGPPEGAYSALVANYHPSDGKLQRIMDAGLDQFFGEANDLVVPSSGGWRIDRSDETFIPSSRIGCFGPGGNLPGNSVTHVNFFRQAETVDFLVNALEGRRQPLYSIDPRKPLPDRALIRGAELRGGPPPPEAVPRAVRPRASRRAERAAPAAEVSRVLRVQVMNGDLSFEADPLMLGHYASSRLTGTERVMDGLIGGAMGRSLRSGLYPSAVGMHQSFINDHVDPDRANLIPKPRAVIVVGLGGEGRLKHVELVNAVRLAVINWARREAEPGSTTRGKTFELSSTLMGSGGPGVSAGQAASLIVRGVLAANDWLDNPDPSKAKPWPLCSRIRFVEVYLDRAAEAWRALRQQEVATPGRIAVEDQVLEGKGGQPRPRESSYRGAPYDFVTVSAVTEANGETRIEYNLDTRRARSEIRGQHTQSLLVRKLVESASNDRAVDHRIGKTLFNLLVPIDLEVDLARSDALVMDLDRGVADIPWELLDVRDGDHAAGEAPERPESRDAGREPWSIRVKLLRKLRTDQFRAHVVDADVIDRVLVIGEPKCPDEYPPLDGARWEALAVKTLLDSMRVDAKLLAETPESEKPDAHEVINTLFESSWRIVHVAGHGALARKEGEQTGVVLSDGTFLGAAEIEAMRVVPELVFINCCHLGSISGSGPFKPYDRAVFASSVAQALIGIGVRCVIAAGWAVDDRGAQAFAERFYGEILEGARFIDAVTNARMATYRSDPDSNTWAAYQCYGDPDWTWKLRDSDGRPARIDPRLVASARGLREELERMAITTQVDGANVPANLETLAILEERFADKWGSKGDVAHAFGTAYFENAALGEAIPWLEAAVTAADAKAPLRAAEQLANARSRFAWESVEKAMRRLESAKERQVKALEEAGSKSGTVSRAAATRRAEARSVAEADRLVKRARRSFDKAIADAGKSTEKALRELARLATLVKTMERESLVGSTHKRRALVAAADHDRRGALEELRQMKAAYEKALEVGKEAEEPNLYYPGVNCLAAEVAIAAEGSAGGGKKSRGRRRGFKLDKRVLETVETSLKANSGEKAEFFSEVSAIEVSQYQAMAAASLGGKLASLQRDYEDLHRRAKSPRKWASVYENACLVLGRYAEFHRPARGRNRQPNRKVKSSQKRLPEHEAAEKLLALIRGFAQRKAD